MSKMTNRTKPKKAPRTQKKEPVPLKLMFLVPAAIAAALWIGYQLNEPGADGKAPARGERAATHAATQTDGAAADAGLTRPPADPTAPRGTQASADSASSNAEDPQPTGRIYIM